MSKSRKDNFSIDSVYSSLYQNLLDLREVIKEHCRMKGTRSPIYEDLTELYCLWEIENARKIDNQFRSIEPLVELKPAKLHALPDISAILRAYPLFLNINKYWEHLYEETLIYKILEMPPYERENVIKAVLLGCVGFFTEKKGFQLQGYGPCYGMAAFIRHLAEGCLILVTEVYRFPEVEENKVVSLHYTQFLKFLEIAPYEATDKLLKHYYERLQQDSSKWVLPSEVQWQDTDPKNWFVSKKRIVSSLEKLTLVLTESEKNSFLYNSQINRWITTSEANTITIMKNRECFSVLSKVNSDILNNLLTPENCKLFIKVLRRIKKFEIQLSDDEIELIGTTGNVLVIGRSGTGKTTSSVLRLFAIQYLYRFNA